MKIILFLIFILSTLIILPVYGIDLSELENVGLKNKYLIIFDGNEFEIEIVANFQVVSHAFSETDKSLTFNIETGRDIGNESEVYVPRGIFVDSPIVLLDGLLVSPIINKNDNTFYIGMTNE